MPNHILSPQEFVAQVANTDGPLCRACGFHHEASPGHPGVATLTAQVKALQEENERLKAALVG